MADINVEPKTRQAILLLLLSGIGLIAILFFLTRWINDRALNAANNTTTAVTNTSSHATSDWNAINFNVPAANYNEITIREIIVRGTNTYAIYSIKEEILFENGKSTFTLNAIQALHQIANSIEQRYTNGLIRIYGNANAAFSDEITKQLTQQRVETVRSWLLENGNIAAVQISIDPLKKTQTGVSIHISKNMQQNHCINIVAKRPA